MEKDIIIYGGAFNPPTVAHQQIIEQCLSLPDFDEVWVMPSGDRLDKQMDSSDAQRIAMLGLLHREVFAGDNRFVVSNFELSLPRPSETVYTARALQTTYPDSTFWFLFGADSYQSMPSWLGGKALQQTLPLLLMPRDGIELPAESERIKHLPGIAGSVNTLSSSAVRAAVAEQRNIRSMVPASIKTFIGASALYAPNTSQTMNTAAQQSAGDSRA